MNGKAEPHGRAPNVSPRALTDDTGTPTPENVVAPETCPFSSFAITRRPEWTDLDLGAGSSVTFHFIGKRILYACPRYKFRMNRDSKRRLVELRRQVLQDLLPADEPFVELRDYSQVKGPLAGRVRVEFAGLGRTAGHRLLGFVALSPSLPAFLAFKAAERLLETRFPVVVARRYSSAIKQAVALLHRHEPLDSLQSLDPTPNNGIDKYVDEILGYIGSINWELDGVDDPADAVPQSHPFRAVFEAVTSIKKQLDSVIQEQERVTVTLKQNEEKYRSIIEDIGEGYFEVDLNGRFKLFNQSLCEMLGYTSDEMWELTYGDLIARLDLENAVKQSRHIMQTGIPRKFIDLNLVSKDGSIRFVGASATLIRDATGKPCGFRGLARDLTERRKAEEERKRLQKEIEHAEKLEIMGTLAGGVAHDLNNILTGVVSYPDMLLLDLPADSQLRRPLLTIQQSGEKAAAIVQDLLTLARRGFTASELVDVNSLIQDYLESPELKFLKSVDSAEVEADLDADLLNLRGSKTHLYKALVNLVTNAAEAMSRGGTVRLSTKNEYLEGAKLRGGLEEGDFVALSITDTGVGIPKEDLQRIFEPFYSKKVLGRSGTGLGMAVVWATVRDHQGHIEIDSVEGKGTTVTLYLPATREEIQEQAAGIALEDFRGGGERLLVVDDAAEQRAMAAKMLGMLGYRVTTVAGGEEAVAYVKDHAADLVILDMIMEPGIDGLETYRRLLTVRPGQRAIITSGFSESDRVKAAQRLGAGKYVKKPFLLEQIARAVKEELVRSLGAPETPYSG